MDANPPYNHVNGFVVDGQQLPPLPPPSALVGFATPSQGTALDSQTTAIASDTPTSPSPATPSGLFSDPQQLHLSLPLPVQKPSFSSFDSASVVPQLSTPQDPDSIPIHAPQGTPPPPQGELLEDVQMAEEPTSVTAVPAQEDEPPALPETVFQPAQPLAPVVAPVPTSIPVPDLQPKPEPAAPASVPIDQREDIKPAMEQSRELAASPGKKRTVDEMQSEQDGYGAATVVSSPPLGSPDGMEVDTPKAEVSTPVPLAPAPVDGAQAPQLGHSLSAPTLGRQENGEPPVKRQRLTPQPPDLRIHTNGLSHPRISTFSVHQHRFATASIRQLKKNRDAGPFLKPVDAVGLNIPHYFNVIKRPMDLGTVEEKLMMSNPSPKNASTKQKEGQQAPLDAPDKRYWSAEEFITDVRLTFDNAIKFNGEAHVVSQMAKRLELIFDKQIEKMPAADEPKPVMPVAQSAPIIPSAPSPPPAPAPVPPKQQRRQSIAVPVIRRNSPQPLSATAMARPKREIHPPPPKDLPYAEPTPIKGKKARGKGKGKERDDGTQEQLRFCTQVIQHLYKKQFYQCAYAFYDPVDHVALNIPDYPKIVKKPMDLSTMKKKLEAKQYENPMDFHADFKLMIKNCRLYNPTGSPVREAGEELNRVFDEKWKGLPPLIEPEEDDEEEEEEVESEADDVMAGVEAQVQKLVKTLEQMKKAKADKEKKKKAPGGTPKEEGKGKAGKPRKPKPAATAAAASAPAPVAAGPSKPRKSKKEKGEESDEDGPVDFFKKRELAEEIPKLEGQDLTDALSVIQEGMADQNSIGQDEEIELDIDVLAPSVIRRLYRMVVEPAKKRREAEEKKKARASGAAVGGGRAGGNAGKGASGRKGHPTGGLKRKSMDEAAEAEKIRMLEQRLHMFNHGGEGGGAVTTPGGSGGPNPALMMDVDESVSTDDESSSDEDDSGSE